MDAVDWAENESRDADPTEALADGRPHPDALAAILLDMRKAFDLMNRDYLRDVLRLVCERGERRDVDAVLTWSDLLLGTVDMPHLRAIRINGTLTRFFATPGGTPQGLEPSPFFYNMGSEGLSGLLTEAGVRGITIRISAERTTHYACAKFADDYAGFVRARHLHAVFDCVDVFCCGTVARRAHGATRAAEPTAEPRPARSSCGTAAQSSTARPCRRVGWGTATPYTAFLWPWASNE